LNDLSLKVRKGEFITLLGRNGSGKTTVFKSILGIIKPFSGSVIIAGTALTGAAVRAMRLKTGYVPQYFLSENDFPITALDVIAMGKNKKQALKWAGEMKLGTMVHKPFGALSGGEKQKTLLAMALSREPEILLLDEPNLNLDMRAYGDFMELVGKMKASLNLTVIHATHLAGHIPKSCKRIVVVKDGRIIMDGPKAGILKNKNNGELIYG
jgi:ABC-type Mn2+/Zn2+ transport system ATPase subunit